MTQLQVLWLLLSPALVLSQVPAPVLPETARGQPPGCPNPSMCGNVTIPYPFGLSEACSWDESFTLSCNHSISPPRLYRGDFEVIDITLETGEMRVYSAVSRICFNSSKRISVRYSLKFDFTSTPSFLVKPGRNEFTGIGCYSLAFINGKEDGSYFSGCLTTCTSLDEAVSAGNSGGCTGIGCCQIPTPSDLDFIDVGWSSSLGNSAWEYSPCSYALVAEKGWYKFSINDLNGTGEEAYNVRVGERSAPLVLDWAINISRDGACVSSNSYHINVRDGQGYLCNCSEGFEGNPYVKDGCKNINECELRRSGPAKYEKLYPCYSGSKCHDTEGSYKCKCNFLHKGDGKIENGCQPRIPLQAWIALGIFVSVAIVCLVIVWLHRRKLRKHFNKNGGDLLKELGIDIFPEAYLKKITNGYTKSIGEGAYGKVFKGTIDGTQHVAVKRSAPKGKTRPVEEFRNEITFQIRINNHRNVVRLVGCCLETDVPMLVFEFVPKGSLYNVLHGMEKSSTLPLVKRLDIAIGSAEALAYMHTFGGQNRVHGDVKPANILLDNELKPKVSDFGSSKLLTIGYTRSFAADMSYIDPVCLKTGRLTVKSDVYSFGVVLLELITRKKAMYDNNSLPVDFVKSWKKEGNGAIMYDTELLSDDADSHHCMECLHRIGALAVRCLKEDQDERPTMEVVLQELKQVRVIASGASCSEAS